LTRIPGTPHGLAGSGWIAIDKSNVRQYPFWDLDGWSTTTPGCGHKWIDSSRLRRPLLKLSS